MWTNEWTLCILQDKSRYFRSHKFVVASMMTSFEFLFTRSSISMEVFHYTWRAPKMSFFVVSHFRGWKQHRDLMATPVLKTRWRLHINDAEPSSNHYGDVIMGTIASQITSLAIVFSTVYFDADQRKHQGSASLAFVRGIHRRPVNSPHKWPVTRELFPFGDVIMFLTRIIQSIWDTVDTPSTNLEPRENSFGELTKCSETPHYTDVIMGAIASQIIPASRLFTQPFIQTQKNENINAPRHWPLCGEFTGDRQYRGKCFHLMSSLCIRNHDRLTFADAFVHPYSRKDNFISMVS